MDALQAQARPLDEPRDPLHRVPFAVGVEQEQQVDPGGVAGFRTVVDEVRDDKHLATGTPRRHGVAQRGRLRGPTSSL